MTNCDNLLNMDEEKLIRSENFLEKLTKNLIVNLCAEFCQVSTLFNLNDKNSYMGFSHTKIVLQQDSETRGITTKDI